MPRRALRPDPARARRLLATAALLVAAAELATGLVLDATPAAVRFASAAKILEKARALAGAPHVLVLGSSRFVPLDMPTVGAAMEAAGAAPSPRLLKGALEGGDPVVADYLVERLLAEGARPALVAVEVSPETLARPAPWITDHVIRFFTWRDVVAWAPEIVLGDRPTRALAARLSPLAFYRRELLTWLVGRPPPYLRVPPSVAAPTPPAAVGATDDVAPRVRLRPDRRTLSGVRQTRRWLRRYRIDGIETRSLERLLDRCRDRHIPVVLVGVPVSRWVRELYTPEVERVFADYVATVGRRYGVELLDYRARMPDELFKDHHHLNARGATVFAGVLGREALAPRWTSHRGDP